MISNMQRLVIERSSQITAERSKSAADDLRVAMDWAKNVVRLVRLAPGGGIYQTDEEAAAEILRRIDQHLPVLRPPEIW